MGVPGSISIAATTSTKPGDYGPEKRAKMVGSSAMVENRVFWVIFCRGGLQAVRALIREVLKFLDFMNALREHESR